MIFNWHDQPEGVLKWMLPTLLSDVEDLGPFSEATDNFQNVELTIAINGIPVDTKRFVDSLASNMEHMAQRAAYEKLTEIPKFCELENILHSANQAAKQLLLSSLEAAGITLDPEDYEY